MIRTLFAFTIALSFITARADDSPKACVSGPFTEERVRLLAGDWASPEYVRIESQANSQVPPEISRIQTGVISFYQGGFINDGIISWTAYDAERNVFVSVLGGAGPRLDRAPKTESLQPNQLVRYTSAAGYQRSEFVTIVSSTSGERSDVFCALNSIVSDPPVERFYRIPPTDSLASRLTVLRERTLVTKGDSPRREGLERNVDSILSRVLEPAISKAYRN